MMDTKSCYRNVGEYWADQLKLLDLRIKCLMELQSLHTDDDSYESPHLKGLVILDSEVNRLLTEGEPVNRYDLPAVKERRNAVEYMEQEIAERVRASDPTAVILPLHLLSRRFNLTSFEQHCVLICFASELNRKYERLYGYLQDNVNDTYPTIDLVLRLLCISGEEKIAARSHFSDQGMLRSFFLKQENDPGSSSISLKRKLVLKERLLNFLLQTAPENDKELSPFMRLFSPDEPLSELIVGSEKQQYMIESMEMFQKKHDSREHTLFYFLNGETGSGKKLQVKHFAKYFKRKVLLVNMKHMLTKEAPFIQPIRSAKLESFLQDAVLCFDHMEALLRHEKSEEWLHRFWDEMKHVQGALFLLSAGEDLRGALPDTRFAVDVYFPVPDEKRREVLWEHFAQKVDAAGLFDTSVQTGIFSFTAGQIEKAVFHFSDRLTMISGEKAPDYDKLLSQSCYMLTRHNLHRKAKKLQSNHMWKGLILPDDQKELLHRAVNHMKYKHIVFGEWGFHDKLSYGKGLNLLLTGSPGTGKTLSAQVLANELNLEIYKIDLSKMVSKYIGETEKNLNDVFDEAELSHSILFFDEADALFGKRSEVKNAHDKYANIETSYLLQKMEEYEGITVLATNFTENIDDAFIRRFNYVIQFPFPDAHQREEIWRSLIPREVPMADNIDFIYLSEKLQITGGEIKNIILSAAFLAAEEAVPLAMKHLIHAARHELRKKGKMIVKEDFSMFL